MKLQLSFLKISSLQVIYEELVDLFNKTFFFLISESLTKSIETLDILDEATIASYLENFQCYYSNQPTTWKYSCHLFYHLATVINSVDLNTKEKSEMLNMNQLNALVHAVEECSTNALEVCVKKHQNRVTYSTTTQSDDEYKRLVSCLRMFNKFFSIKIISSNSLFDDTKLDYIIGLLSVISLKRNQDDVMEFFKIFSEITNIFPGDLVFKFIMMIKGFNINGASKDFQLVVHRELMRLIRSPNGFLMLCRNILVKPDDGKIPILQKHSMISKIIEAVAASKTHQKFMVEEVFRTFDFSIKNNNRDIIGACAFVIKNLEAKECKELKMLVHSLALEPLKELLEPEDLVFGMIVMEDQQLQLAINKLHVLFSSSTVSSLPSSILASKIELLYNLFCIISDPQEKDKLAAIIVFFLRNREQKELKKIIQQFRLKDNGKGTKLHPRICYKNKTLQIAGESQGISDDSEQFLHLVKTSNNNFLIYDIFLCLINILGDVQHSGDNFLSEYNVSKEDLPEVLHRKFFKKLAILEPLQEMIQWNSLHSQLNEKPKEVLDVIKKVLVKIVEKSDVTDEHTMIIFFSLFKELMHKLKDENQRLKMKKEVEGIKRMCRSKELRDQIDLIFNLNEEIPNVDPSQMSFDDAMKLLHSPEIYCKVYGSDTLVKLLKKRDKQTVLNRHTILAVALINLKETESYAYLNVIRLLVALSYVMDSEVVDALIAEYDNEELVIDERLKLGEVIVKVTEDLGEMSAKFKQQLIQCFLKGSRDKNNEFRTSSLVNVGTICKILSFQIHNFFQELHQTLESIIKTDEFLPTKRAAAMVLSQILAGLPNLMDFQDFLLPIYHLLKDILANESDPQTRIHAEVGIEHLNAKTKDFLNPKLDVVKEIKIRLEENPHKIHEIKFK